MIAFEDNIFPGYGGKLTMRKLTMAFLSASIGLSAAHGADRPFLRSASELPPSQITLAEPPSSAFLSQTFLTEVLPLLLTQAEQMRQQYEIVDPDLARKLRDGLAAIALLQHRPDDALGLVAEARATAEKP